SNRRQHLCMPSAGEGLQTGLPAIPNCKDLDLFSQLREVSSKLRQKTQKETMGLNQGDNYTGEFLGWWTRCGQSAAVRCERTCASRNSKNSVNTVDEEDRGML